MAINLPGVPFKLLAEDMGIPNYQRYIQSGIDSARKFQEEEMQQQRAKYLPGMLAQKLISSHLKNKVASQIAPYAEQLAQANLGLKNAQINRANRPEQPQYGNFEKAMQGYERIKQQYGDNSPQAQMAKSYAKRLSQGQQGMQLSVDPQTKAITFSQGGYGNRQPNQQIIQDENGRPILISLPTKTTQNSSQKSSVAEIGRQMIAKEAEMPYVGTGSNFNLLKDRTHYLINKDKESGKRLVKAAVAEMLVPEYAGLQLTAQNVPATVEAVKHQMNVIKQGWPGSSDIVVNNLPPELQKEAKKQHSIILKRIKEAKDLQNAKGFPIKLSKKEDTNISKNNPAEGFVSMKKNGRLYHIPRKDAERAKLQGYDYER